jgi:hypothetical protein
MPNNIEDFWKYVDILGEDDCWNWKLWKNTKGYGRWKVCKKTIFCHRHAYEISIGPIPDGYHILHHCDNPLCCNPKHLFAGTNKDNVNDRVSKNRSADCSGELNSRAKLTNKDVVQIRELCKTMRQTDIAKLYNVTRTIINSIIKKRSWKNIL